MRWHILRILLYKELLRYRYNWGLLALVVALLALSALTAISARVGKLPGQDEDLVVSQCYICYDSTSPSATSWAEYLRMHPPRQRHTITYHELRDGDVQSIVDNDARALVIELCTDPNARRPDNRTPSSLWQARYCYRHIMRRGMFTYRDWFNRETQNFLGQKPLLDESNVRFQENTALGNPVGTFMTSLLIFALYLLSFNLYLTSTAEEREKRVLLALLLTPASPVEVLSAKALFHGTASLAIVATMVGTYQPLLLLHPLFWTTAILGSIGYVAVGTVALCLIRRQTTISTVSLLYLVATTLLLLLGQFLPLFEYSRYVLLENYLYRQLLELLAYQPISEVWTNHLLLVLLVVLWSSVAIALFVRQGASIARAR
jgi:hypothetical protein